MSSVSIRVARQGMSTINEEVSQGGSVTITKRGREVARIIPIKPPRSGGHALPDLSSFRKSIKVRGKSLSGEVVNLRREERS